MGQLCGLLIGNAWGTVLLYGVHLRKQLVPRFDLQSVKQAIQYGLPLIPHAMAFVVMNATDRIMMSQYVSIREIGLFSFASTVMGVFMLVVNTLNQAWTPRYYEIMKEESRRRTIIEAYSACSLGLIALFNALGILFGADLLRLVTVADYHGIRPYMGPLSLTSFFLATYYLGATPLYYFKQTKLLPAITLFGAVLNVVLNSWLIPHWGAAGAAYGTVISYAFITVACAVRSQQLGGLFMPYKRIYGLVLAMIIIVICNYGLTSNEWWTVGVKVSLFLFLSSYVGLVLCWPYRTLVTQTL